MSFKSPSTISNRAERVWYFLDHTRQVCQYCWIQCSSSEWVWVGSCFKMNVENRLIVCLGRYCWCYRTIAVNIVWFIFFSPFKMDVCFKILVFRSTLKKCPLQRSVTDESYVLRKNVKERRRKFYPEYFSIVISFKKQKSQRYMQATDFWHLLTSSSIFQIGRGSEIFDSIILRSYE